MNALPIADRVIALRSELWDAGYRPIALYSWNVTTIPERDRGKRPKGDAWQARARRDPPDAVEAPFEGDAINTGILCDGLRAIDIDVEDAGIVASIRAIAVAHLGETAMRYRENSPRTLLVYQAAYGEPGKRQIVGRAGKVEILGRGQQFAAYGRHPSGALLRWMPSSLVQTPRDTLPAVTEEQIGTFFAAAMPLIGATKEKSEGAAVRAEDPTELQAVLQTLIDLGAEQITTVDDLSSDLHQRLVAAFTTSDRLRQRWAGDVADLRAAGRDCSRSGQDFSAAALLKGAGLAPADTAICLLAFDHGSAFDETKHPDGRARLRYVARSALRASGDALKRESRRHICRVVSHLIRQRLAEEEIRATVRAEAEQHGIPLGDADMLTTWVAQREVERRRAAP